MTKDQAMQQAIDFLDGSYEAHAVRKALQEALAQPAQEPVAYTDEHKNFLEWDMVELCYKAVCKKHEAVPLYTHPAPAHPASWRRLSKKKLGKIYGNDEIDWYAYEAIDEALQKLNHF